jgi:hypothetical protein
MKTTKIFNFDEFNAVCEHNASNIQVEKVIGEKISITKSLEPLFESNNLTQSLTNKIENAVIALPYSMQTKVTIDSLSSSIDNYLNSLQLEGESGYSIGNYFDGDYKSDSSLWNHKSLCVSLFGPISDRPGTIAVAVEIMRTYKLPKILIIKEMCLMEITCDGETQIKPLPQNRIKRLND